MTPVGSLKVEPSLMVTDVAALLPLVKSIVLPSDKVAVTPPADPRVTALTVRTSCRQKR